MLRFPNPGSDIDSFVRIFCELFESLKEFKSFGLDDMSAVLVEKNLATSSGYMGAEALRRSTRTDRSRDPLYNQSKMYAELFRVLGWMHPLPKSSLTFRLTFQGQHISEATDPNPLVRECILGIAYPTPILSVKQNNKIRPFSAIIRTAAALDGAIARDEMIVGPMCLQDDRDKDEFDQMLDRLRVIRGTKSGLCDEMKRVSTERSISQVTMTNYTRFPLAVLAWSDWTETKTLKDIYPRKQLFRCLTPDGHAVAKWLDTALDIRADDISGLPEGEQAAFAKYCFFKLMNRAGFDISHLEQDLDDWARLASTDGELEISSEKDIVFSPCQEISTEFFSRHLPDFYVSGQKETTGIAQSSSAQRADGTAGVQVLSFIESATSTSGYEIHDWLQELVTKHDGDVDTVLAEIMEQHVSDNQRQFYPLVKELFCYLGFDCELSRAGVNYQRWDAIIIDDSESIPIEIKSPGEEEWLSLKAVRQALENKVILLSRRPYTTEPDTTSIAIGYRVPNDRSDLTQLIKDIKSCYNISIGVLDFDSLLRMALLKRTANLIPNRRELNKLVGIAHV